MKSKSLKTITFIDLFAGIGGFHLGIRLAAKKLGYQAECCFAVDINNNARATYLQNFPDTPFPGSTKEENDLTWNEVKEKIPNDADILCAGFPCQPFSQAGKKLGMGDDRGTLFEHIVEILKKKQPKAVFLENVRNLANIKNGDGTFVFDTIKKKLADVGYPIEGRGENDWSNWRVLKATDFGLPTHRPRIYMVGFRKDVFSNLGNFMWPKPTHELALTLARFFRDLPKRWTGRVERNGWPDIIGNTLRVGGVGSPVYKKDDGTWFVDRRCWDTYVVNDKKHFLTVDEGKAMMGFPAGFRFGKNLSENQKMKQLGNSVAVPVIKAIASDIIKVLNV